MDCRQSIFLFAPKRETCEITLFFRFGGSKASVKFSRVSIPQERSQIYFHAAAITAEAVYTSSGFRQRDFRFLAEMFSNWMDSALGQTAIWVHNTQAMRYLDDLCADSHAKVSRKARIKTYHISFSGLIHLVRELGGCIERFPLEDFYFVYHFFSTYQESIMNLVKERGTHIPATLKIEMQNLLRPKQILETQIRFVEKEHKKLSQRIRDSKEVLKIVEKGRSLGRSSLHISEDIEKAFPYDLNSQKPLSTFYREIPENIRDWILNRALEARTIEAWMPMERSLKTHLENLYQLKKEAESKT